MKPDYRLQGASILLLLGAASASQAVFSSKYHIKWYRKLVDEQGSLKKTQRFARLFVVPGMNHCGGGPATSQFDAFSAVVNWVENNAAPDSLLGTAPAGTPWPGRTRPLCAYPAQVRYVGQGSIEAASSFVCVSPAEEERHHKDGDED
jgi:Tannase and feruloyl esterase